MAEANLRVQRDRSRLTLYVAGDLSAATANQFVDDASAELTAGTSELVVDLADVLLIDSSGTAALGRLLDRAGEHGAAMSIARPRRAVHRALTACGLARVVEVGAPYEPPPR